MMKERKRKKSKLDGWKGDGYETAKRLEGSRYRSLKRIKWPNSEDVEAAKMSPSADVNCEVSRLRRSQTLLTPSRQVVWKNQQTRLTSAGGDQQHHRVLDFDPKEASSLYHPAGQKSFPCSASVTFSTWLRENHSNSVPPKLPSPFSLTQRSCQIPLLITAQPQSTPSSAFLPPYFAPPNEAVACPSSSSSSSTASPSTPLLPSSSDPLSLSSLQQNLLPPPPPPLLHHHYHHLPHAHPQHNHANMSPDLPPLLKTRSSCLVNSSYSSCVSSSSSSLFGPSRCSAQAAEGCPSILLLGPGNQRNGQLSGRRHPIDIITTITTPTPPFPGSSCEGTPPQDPRLDNNISTDNMLSSRPSETVHTTDRLTTASNSSGPHQQTHKTTSSRADEEALMALPNVESTIRVPADEPSRLVTLLPALVRRTRPTTWPARQVGRPTKRPDRRNLGSSPETEAPADTASSFGLTGSPSKVGQRPVAGADEPRVDSSEAAKLA
ncbi:unnamed protein product, partial [Protopolystoma xenopodis]